MSEESCKYCRGLGHCPGCENAAELSLGGVLRKICQTCLGTGECPKCEGVGLSAKLTTIGAWRQAVVQDGLLI